MIKEIAFTAYPAKDVAGLRKWYEEKLGLKFSGPFEEDGVEKYNEANVGGGYFSVLTHEWIERDPGSASGVVFEVDDIDNTIADLRGKGVEVDDPYCDAGLQDRLVRRPRRATRSRSIRSRFRTNRRSAHRSRLS